MKANIKLDIEVAEKVLGLCVHDWDITFDDWDTTYYDWDDGWQAKCKKCELKKEGGGYMLTPRNHLVKPFSTDISAAWLVWDRMLELGYEHPMVRKDTLRPSDRAQYTATFSCTYYNFRGDADTAPLAICIAALKAIND